MSSYSEADLRDAVFNRIAMDKDIAAAIDQAIKRKQRGWLANLVIDIARFVFGTVAGDIVERVVDWLIRNR